MNLALHRDRPRMALRIWTGTDGPLPAPSGCLAVEWAGRVGHPSSYALLGGSLDPQPDADLRPQRVKGTLAGRLDTVHGGLLAEYREAIDAATDGRLHIATAAHGDVGSSQVAFSRLATLLLALLNDGVPDSEEILWRLWDATDQHG